MELAARGIKVVNGVRATGVMADRVKLDDGREIRTENVVWTAGIRPNAKLEDLDLPLTERDGVVVDERLRVTSRPGGGSGRACRGQKRPRRHRQERGRTRGV